MTLHSLFEIAAKVLGDLDGGHAILDLLRRFVNGLAILLNAQRPPVSALQGRVVRDDLRYSLLLELRFQPFDKGVTCEGVELHSLSPVRSPVRLAAKKFNLLLCRPVQPQVGARIGFVAGRLGL